MAPDRVGWRTAVRFAAAIGALAVLAGIAWFVAKPSRLPEGVSRDDYDAAARKFREVYGRSPGRLDVLSLAGELAVGDGRLETAAACFSEIPDADRRYGPSARLQGGQVLLKLNRAAEAEANFREFLSLASHRPSLAREHVAGARRLLSYVLSVEIRLEERRPVLAEMHADGQADVFHSKQLYFPHLLIWHSTTGRRRLPDWLDEDPANPRLREAEGRYLTAEGRLDEARAWLDDLHSEVPESLTCAAALLECLFESNDWENFSGLARSLPDYTPGQPWLLTRMRGELALHTKDWPAAVRHFESLLADDPANPWCQMGLARAYAALDRPGDRDRAQRRALVLSRIRVHLLNVEDDDPGPLLVLAGLCDEIGFEAAAETFRRHAEGLRSTREFIDRH